MTRRDIKEAVLHLAIYGSFPKTLQAVRRLNQLYEIFDRQGLYQTGDSTTHPAPMENYVSDPEMAKALFELDSQFGDLAVRMAGEVWGRPGLSPKERSYLCLAANVCHQTLDGPFQFHVDMALKGGATPEQIREVILHMAAYGSFPKALQAIRALREHLAKKEW